MLQKPKVVLMVYGIVQTLKYYKNIMNIFDNISNILLIHHSDQSDQRSTIILTIVFLLYCLSLQLIPVCLQICTKCQVWPEVNCSYSNTLSSFVVLPGLFEIDLFSDQMSAFFL